MKYFWLRMEQAGSGGNGHSGCPWGFGVAGKEVWGLWLEEGVGVKNWYPPS